MILVNATDVYGRNYVLRQEDVDNPRLHPVFIPLYVRGGQRASRLPKVLRRHLFGRTFNLVIHRDNIVETQVMGQF